MTLESLTHESAKVNFHTMLVRVREHFNPPPDITISEWAMRNRSLPKGTTSRPGPFRPEVFQVAMMDVILNPLVHEVVIQKSTQVGFTDAVLLNIIGYYIDADPRPIMYVLPTIDNAKDKGKKAITPMIENCPALRRKIKPPTTDRKSTRLNSSHSS